MKSTFLHMIASFCSIDILQYKSMVMAVESEGIITNKNSLLDFTSFMPFALPFLHIICKFNN